MKICSFQFFLQHFPQEHTFCLQHQTPENNQLI